MKMNFAKKATALAMSVLFAVSMAGCGSSASTAKKVEVTSVEDLADLKIGVQTGTTGDSQASDAVNADSQMQRYNKGADAKLATTSSTGGLLLALQRAIVTARPKGRYRKHFCWPAIKRYYSNLLVSILLLALLYTFELLHLLYCQSFQHNIL